MEGDAQFRWNYADSNQRLIISMVVDFLALDSFDNVKVASMNQM